MKIEKVAGNQIRVIITSADLVDLNLTMEKLTPDSPDLHTFLFRIMEKVKLETGFNPYNGQIMVEATPSFDGVTLLVTKIGEGKEILKKRPKSQYKNIRAVKKQPTLRMGIYGFDTFEALCNATKLMNVIWLQNSILYKMEEAYYLLIHTEDAFPKYHSVLSEFCSQYNYPVLFEQFLKEHAKVVAEKESLIKMVEEIKKLC